MKRTKERTLPRASVRLCNTAVPAAYEGGVPLTTRKFRKAKPVSVFDLYCHAVQRKIIPSGKKSDANLVITDGGSQTLTAGCVNSHQTFRIGKQKTKLRVRVIQIRL